MSPHQVRHTWSERQHGTCSRDQWCGSGTTSVMACVVTQFSWYGIYFSTPPPRASDRPDTLTGARDTRKVQPTVDPPLRQTPRRDARSQRCQRQDGGTHVQSNLPKSEGNAAPQFSRRESCHELGKHLFASSFSLSIHLRLANSVAE